MKTLLCLALLFVATYANFCDHDSDCNLIVCGAGWRVECYEHSGSHVCTCIPGGDGDNDGRCASQADCLKNHGDCRRDSHTWHCVDTRCRCF